MKKVKKMALGGMGARTQSQMQASVPRTQAQMQATQRGGLSSKNASQAFQSAGMNVNLPTGQRGFSSTPTMGGVGPKPSTPLPAPKVPPKPITSTPISNLKPKPSTPLPAPKVPPKPIMGGINPNAKPPSGIDVEKIRQGVQSLPKGIMDDDFVPKTPRSNMPFGQRLQGMMQSFGQLGQNNASIQKINTSPPPPGTPALQRFSTPEQYKQAEAAYKQMQQQQQLVNSIGRLPQANDLGQVGSQLTRTISGAEAKALGLGIKKGGAVKMKSGGKTSSASKRADGIATKGKTRGRMV